MKAKHSVAIILTASALMTPGLPLYAADANDRPTGETMGEKIDDAAITSKVKMELMGNRGTSALHTEVNTTNGVVTLTGKAKNEAEKELAALIAKNVKGVKKVNNNMIVEPSK